MSLARILLKSGADAAAVAKALKAQLSSDVQVLTKAEFIQFEADYWQRNTAIGFIFSLGVGMGFIVGIIIVYQILYSDVNDHLSEYATLKAMGYRNRYLLRVVFEEALILSISGFIPGHLISIFLYNLTQSLLYFSNSAVIYPPDVGKGNINRNPIAFDLTDVMT